MIKTDLSITLLFRAYQCNSHSKSYKDSRLLTYFDYEIFDLHKHAL